MDPLLADFVTDFTAVLANAVVEGVGPRLRKVFAVPEQMDAIERCLKAGMVAFLDKALEQEPGQNGQLRAICQTFFRSEEFGKQLSPLLKGNKIELDELEYLFEEAGYSAENLPALDLGELFDVFEEAFLEAAIEEPELQGVIQTGQAVKQTGELRKQTARQEQIAEDVHEIRRANVDGPRSKAKALRGAYLNHVYESCRYLSLSSLDVKVAGGGENRLELAAVYTAMLAERPHSGMLKYYWASVRPTETSVKLSMSDQGKPSETIGLPYQVRQWVSGDGAIPYRLSRMQTRNGPFDSSSELDFSRIVWGLPALGLLNSHSRLVLLGDPGSGKSTFVKLVALCLAGQALAHKKVNLRLLTSPIPHRSGEQMYAQEWDLPELIPILIEAQEYALYLVEGDRQNNGTAGIWDFIETRLGQDALRDFAVDLQSELMVQGGLLLIDGLDEVPPSDRLRVRILEHVTKFATVFPDCRIVLTCRTYAHEKGQWVPPEFEVFKLAPFGEGQIRHFIDRWYAHVGPLRGLNLSDGQARADLLKRAVLGDDRLRALAKTPLLLTLTASLHAWGGGNLPEDREQLYTNMTDLLLDSWERSKLRLGPDGKPKLTQPSLAEWLKADKKELRKALNELAFEIHKGDTASGESADIQERDLIQKLLNVSRNSDVNPVKLADFLSQRAGLILAKGEGVYSFPHRTFQEYLAACHLSDIGFPGELANLGRSDPERWREVVLLAGAKAGRGTTYALFALVKALCFRESKHSKAAVEDLWGAHLAGQLLVESADLYKINEGDEPEFDRVRKWLVHIVEKERLDFHERVLAANNLARLGDPRAGVGLDSESGLPHIEWCVVPAGPFVMGSDCITPFDGHPVSGDSFREHLLQIRRHEGPEHRLDIPYAFWIARYPVTVEQMQAFATAHGKSMQTYWDAAFEEKKVIDGTRRWLFICDDWELKDFCLPNHPVVGVTWFDAWEFASWITNEMRQAGALPAKYVVRLPTEAEWEKAVRGGLKVPDVPLVETKLQLDHETKSLRENPRCASVYPWGEEFEPDLAAFGRTSLTSTIPVGCFPRGASPYGCLDMMGNVWEWTLDIRRPYPYRPDYAMAGQDSESERAMRGGAFSSLAIIRCTSRAGQPPSVGDYDTGFRLVVGPDVPEARLVSNDGTEG